MLSSAPIFFYNLLFQNIFLRGYSFSFCFKIYLWTRWLLHITDVTLHKCYRHVGTSWTPASEYHIKYFYMMTKNKLYSSDLIFTICLPAFTVICLCAEFEVSQTPSSNAMDSHIVDCLFFMFQHVIMPKQINLETCQEC